MFGAMKLHQVVEMCCMASAFLAFDWLALVVQMQPQWTIEIEVITVTLDRNRVRGVNSHEKSPITISV